MKTKLIYKGSRRRLILIFAGWSTTPDFYRDLHADGWDIAVVWDFSSLDFDASILDDYETVFVIAWSLGVAAAAHAAATSLDATRVSAAFAVNGTLFPSSDQYGIPEAVFEATQATLNARNLLKFTKRMGYVQPSPATMPPLLSDEIYIPDFEKLSFELRNVRDNALRGNLPWKRAYVSLNDRIFNPDAMVRAWEENSEHPVIVCLDAPHYIHLQGVIDTVTPDVPHIANRFSKAQSTYNDNASAQQQIVDRLMEFSDGKSVIENPTILEIGVGSGMLSRRLKDAFHPSSATFVDIYPIMPMEIAPEENYVKADAEAWITSASSASFDIIASASTIQWFADPENFFRHASRILHPGGILICSTFIEGNLEELDTNRPSPLIYRNKNELESMVRKYFRDVEIKEESISLTFPSRREMMMHLKRTGVAGGKPSSLPIASTAAKSESNTLTYKPLYIIAKV